MNSTCKNGLFGIAFTAMATVILTSSAVAQLPLPDTNQPTLDQPANYQPAPEIEIPLVISSSVPAAIPAAVTVVEPEAAPAEIPVAIPQPIRLVESIPSSSDYSDRRPTVAELRQARAQYRTQQRIERMERNLWAGYEPLRPSWNALPMMSSRYPYQTRVVVPYYIYPR